MQFELRNLESELMRLGLNNLCWHIHECTVRKVGFGENPLNFAGVASDLSRYIFGASRIIDMLLL